MAFLFKRQNRAMNEILTAKIKTIHMEQKRKCIDNGIMSPVIDTGIDRIS